MKYNKVFGILAVSTLLSILNFNEAKAFNIPDGLSFARNSLAGMSEEEAKTFIENKYQEEQNRQIKINFDKDKLLIKYGDISKDKKDLENILASIDPYIYSNVVKRFEYKENLKENPLDLNIELEADKEAFSNLVEEKYKNLATSSDPVDAKITRLNGEFVITREQDVQDVDIDETFDRLENELKNNTSDIDIDAVINTKEAKIKAKDLESIKDILGTYTTNFASSGVARATNIAVGTSKINGSVLMPGETLSGYELMHPFTVANGYKTAGAYENGRVVDSVGGGVCQIATTLYNASLRAEIGIVQRNNHSMTVAYVPASSDAAIAGTVKDLKISNTYDTPIYIEGEVKGRTLTFTIWGSENRDKNRSIEFVSEILSETPMGVSYQDDASLPSGKEVKVSTGHNGRVSKLWKVIKVDGVEKERVLVSSDKYMMSNSIIRRGTGILPNTQVPVISEVPSDIASSIQETSLAPAPDNIESVETLETE